MSKIGKKPIAVPSGVQITADLPAGLPAFGGAKGDQGRQAAILVVKGPKGQLVRELPAGFEVRIEGEWLFLERKEGIDSAQWGLYRALVRNMIIGVNEGFSRTLEFQGVGYKAAVKGNELELNLGYSHPVTVKAPEGITFSVEKNAITVSGIDKELVGHVAAEVRSQRTPEPYKLSGIKYAGEIIKKKAGKKAVATA